MRLVSVVSLWPSIVISLPSSWVLCHASWSPFCSIISGGFPFLLCHSYIEDRIFPPTLHFHCFFFTGVVLTLFGTIFIPYVLSFFLYRIIYSSFVWLKQLKNWLVSTCCHPIFVLPHLNLIPVLDDFEMNVNELFIVVCDWSSQYIKSLNHSSLVCKIS